MVESIKNTISRMEPRKANNNHAVPQTANKSAATTSSTDSVKLKSAEICPRSRKWPLQRQLTGPM